MAKNNKNMHSLGIFSSLEAKHKTPPKLPQAEQKAVITNISDENSNDFKKPKRFSSKNGEEFTIRKGMMITKSANRKLNLVKGYSENLSYNELLDEAIHEYCDKRLK